MAIAPHIKEIMNNKNASAIRKMFEEGNILKQKYGEENVFDFSIGNPDLDPPSQVIKTIKDIAEEEIKGCHGYMPNAGYIQTRQAIANKISLEQGISLDGNSIIMSVGAAAALNCVFKAILSPEDEIIVPAPFFAEYTHYTRNHGGVLFPVSTNKDFSLNIKNIENALSLKTAAVLINSPNNPTGKIYTEQEIKELIQVLENHGKKTGRKPYLICDEPYRDIVYENKTVSSIFPFYSESIIVSSFAKNLSIPGERLGYLCVNPLCSESKELIASCILATRILGYVNAPAFFQRVIAKSWNSSVDFSSYEKRRNLLMKVLDEVGIDYAHPEGAFYLFCRVPPKKSVLEAQDTGWIGDDNEFCSHLKEYKILCAPGTGFGCSGWFRMSYCTSETTIQNCQKAFEEAIKIWQS